MDNDFEDPNGDVDAEENSSTTKSADDGDDNDMDIDQDSSVVSADEVTDLMNDAGAQGTFSTPDNVKHVLSRPVNRPPPDDKDSLRRIRKEMRQRSELIQICRNYGWPGLKFSKAACTEELREWTTMDDAR